MVDRPHLKEYHWKPGQSGNPNGRPVDAMKAEARAAKQYAKFKEIMLNLQDLSAEEIKKWLDEPTRTMLETTAGKLVLESSKGNLQALAAMSERLFGKVKDVQEVTQKKDWGEELEKADKEQLITILRKKA